MSLLVAQLSGALFIGFAIARTIELAWRMVRWVGRAPTNVWGKLIISVPVSFPLGVFTGSILWWSTQILPRQLSLKALGDMQLLLGTISLVLVAFYIVNQDPEEQAERTTPKPRSSIVGGEGIEP